MLQSMNDAPPDTKPDASIAPEEPAPAKEKPAKSAGSALSALALIIALGAAGVTGFQWYQARGEDRALRQEMAQRLAAIETRSAEAGARVNQATAALREAEIKLGLLEAKLGESQNQQIALEALYQELSRNRDEWTFADVEQSIVLASQQLQIAGNVRAALIGLENAETRLQRMDQPRYSALRRVLLRDIERLQALPLADVYGVSARLDDVIAAVDRLPLAMDARAKAETVAPATPAAEMPAWERMLREAWRELLQLVRVQRTDGSDVTLLASEQVFFLRETLKLRLLAARIALLSRDAKSYQSDLRAALGALERYFDPGDSMVTATAVTLRKLLATQIQVNVPELTETLEALRKLRPPRAKPPG